MTDDDRRVVEAEIRGELKVFNTRLLHLEDRMGSISASLQKLVWIVIGAVVLRLIEILWISGAPAAALAG